MQKICIVTSLIIVVAVATPQTKIWERSLPTEAGRPADMVQGPDGAMWFTEALASKVGRITANGEIREFPLPNGIAHATTIARGSDGALWVNDNLDHSIGRMTTDGAVTVYPLPPCHYPQRIIAGKNDLWALIRSYKKAIAPYPEGCPDRSALARITTDGAITEFPIAANGLAADPDGRIWFSTNEAVGQITTAGTPEITSKGPPSNATLVAAAYDGTLWFSDYESGTVFRRAPSGNTVVSDLPNGGASRWSSLTMTGNVWFTDPKGNAIGRVTRDGKVDEIALPHPNSYPLGIEQGPDGAIWFTEYNGNRIGRVAGMPPSKTEPYTLASVTLGAPLSRAELQRRNAHKHSNGDGWLWTWSRPEGAVSAYTDRSGIVTSIEFESNERRESIIDLPCTRGFDTQGSHMNLQFAVDDCTISGISTYELPDGSVLDVTFEGPGDGPLQKAVWYRPASAP